MKKLGKKFQYLISSLIILGAGVAQPGQTDLTELKAAAEKGDPKSFDYLLDEFLFRAGASTDLTQAKKYADLARTLHIQWGPDTSKKLKTVESCYSAGAVTIPSTDLPTSQEKQNFRNSESDCGALFPSVTRRPEASDWNSYRKCLLSQDEMDRALVAEIYANGWGVKRNAKLAIALVCHGSQVPAELEGMVDGLESTQEQERLSKDFRFCDYVTSGLHLGICAARAEELAARAQEAEVGELTQKWTSKQKSAFQALKKAGEEYFSERARVEMDLSGTARAQIALDEEARLKAEFLKSLKAFEAGQVPEQVSPAQLAQIEHQLNEIYTTLIQSNEEIRAVQQKWTHYRDLWVRFAQEKYPKTPSDVWKAWMTEQRIKLLKPLVLPEN